MPLRTATTRSVDVSESLAAPLRGPWRSASASGPLIFLLLVAVLAIVLSVAPSSAFAGAPTITEEFASKVEATEATLGAAINPGGEPTTYQVEYGASVLTTPAGVQTSSVPLPVQQTLTGLTAGTEYHYRFVAHSALGTADGEEHAFRTPAPASGGSVSLIDNRQWELVSPPEKNAGQALFEVLSQGDTQAAEDGGAITYLTSEPLPGGASGESNTALNSQNLAVRGPDGWSSHGIAAGDATTAGVTLGEGEEYRIFSPDLSLGLVEQLAVVEEPPLLAPDASERTDYLRADAPLAPEPPEAADYAAARSNGEQSAAEHEPFGVPGYVPLLTRANTHPGARFGTQCLFELLTCTSRYGSYNVEGATPDLSHVVLRSRTGLTEGAEARGAEGGLYEWSAGALQLVSVLPGGEQAGVPFPRTGIEATSNEYDGPVLGGRGIKHATVVRHAISSDGARVIWTDDTEQGSGTALYIRDTSKGETVRLDEPAPGVKPPEGTPAALFQTASPDGSRVFFTDTQRLTADSYAEPSGFQAPGKPDLYMCEVREVAGKLSCNLSDLTVALNGAGEPSERPAMVQGNFGGNERGAVIGASEEACDVGATGECNVYFVARGVLAAANAEGQAPVEGQDNLYVVRYESASGAWAPRFIATLSSEDMSDWEIGEESGNLDLMTSRVSPNGRYLAFMSDRSLTGYDNVDASSPVGEQRPDEEVFLYDTQTARLACASCNPSGARPAGVLVPPFPQVGTLFENRWVAGDVPGWTIVTSHFSDYQSRYLSDDGRLFFDSPDSLVPQATNGTQDVYEYEPEGMGPQGAACEPSSDGATETFKPSREFEAENHQTDEEPAGCVGLISSATSSEESAFVDASASGDDVFFITAAQLVKPDTDDSYDLYDAHVCSQETAPCYPEVAPPPAACESRVSCAGPSPTVPPVAGAPGSATFSGQGNLAGPGSLAPLGAGVAVKPLTRAQKLARELRACRRDKSKPKRAKCERQARQRYGPPRTAKRSSSDRGATS
jgi:hypothetical protein